MTFCGILRESVVARPRIHIEELEKNRIHVSQALIFGSHAKGTANDESDIDVALISEAFTGDRFEDRRKIVPLRRNIDTRIEPIPLKPEDFNNVPTSLQADIDKYI